MTIGLLVLVARLYSRYFITRAPGIDDLLIVVAAAFGVALSVLVIVGYRKYHSGRHVWDIPPSLAPGSRLNAWISQWCYLYSTTAIKISVLLFYRRLSVSFNKPFYWAVWAGIIYNVAQVVAFSIALLAICQPVSAYWMSFSIPWLIQHHGNRHCSYEGASLTASGIVSIFGDLYAALLPSMLIMKLQMPRRQKVALTLLFAVGYAVVGLGIGRTIMLNRVVFHDYDYTWILWDAWIWSVTELWIGLIVASVPSLKPFFRHLIVEPLTEALHTTSGKASWLQVRSPTNTSRASRSASQRPWGFLHSSQGKASAQTTELSTVDGDNPKSPNLYETSQWPLPNDLEKNQGWQHATPALEMHNFHYHGGGRCWSEAAPQRSPSKRLMKAHRKQGSTGSEVLPSQSPIDGQQGRNSHSAVFGGDKSRKMLHSSRSSHALSDTDEIGALPTFTKPEARAEVEQMYNIDRTVEWSISRDEPVERVDGEGNDNGLGRSRPPTRSMADLEERVGQFTAASPRN